MMFFCFSDKANVENSRPRLKKLQCIIYWLSDGYGKTCQTTKKEKKIYSKNIKFCLKSSVPSHRQTQQAAFHPPIKITTRSTLVKYKAPGIPFTTPVFPKYYNIYTLLASKKQPPTSHTIHHIVSVQCYFPGTFCFQEHEPLKQARDMR